MFKRYFSLDDMMVPVGFPQAFGMGMIVRELEGASSRRVCVEAPVSSMPS